MKTIAISLLTVLVNLTGCHSTSWPHVENAVTPKVRGDDTVIAFASCLKEHRRAPIFEHLINAEPDAVIMLGDNIYADIPDKPVRAADFRDKYNTLAAQPYWQNLKGAAPILATWDDHDYGLNDAGKDWHLKEVAKQEFMSFFDVPVDAPMRGREGIYSQVILGEPGRRVQIILLDTRSFRDRLQKKVASGARSGGPYQPTDDTSRELLGEAQWAWLQDILGNPAEVRVIASSIQVVAREHGWECWGNFPHELDRLYRLIRGGGANGVLFISGDRHLVEISKDTSLTAPYPMWDATSSGLNQGERKVSEPNRFRVGGVRRLSNFGLIRVDWSGEPTVMLELVGPDGQAFEQHAVALSELQ